MTVSMWNCPGCDLDPGWCSVHSLSQRSQCAAEFAEHTLAGLPVRLAHSAGVAARMGELCARNRVHPLVADTFVAAAWVHDVGYARPDTGHHAIDGARMLTGTVLEPLAPQVAWHSTAWWEADARCMSIDYVRPNPADHAMLWVADFTTTPHGQPCTVDERVAEIRERYSPESVVIAALDASMPALRQAVVRVR